MVLGMFQYYSYTDHSTDTHLKKSPEIMQVFLNDALVSVIANWGTVTSEENF